MGSFCKPQKLKTTQNASTTALQPYAGAYQQLLNRGLDVSNTAYNPATNASVASFSDPQTQAFNLAQQNVGSYQPYLAAATGAAGLGAAPSYANVGQYMNPFDQYVTGSLLSDYDTMINRNRQMSNSDAAKAGALTGDRRYVAQSIGQEGLDRALASNLAQTRQAGYTQALGAAQADALRQLQATGVLSNLGAMAQQYGYNDVNAMLGIGGLQQAQQQKELDTATQNALRQSAYPFETAQWAANYAQGLGGAAGSQSTGQTTQPGPSWAQQIIGAVAAAAGAAAGAKSDARIKDDIEEIGSTHDGQPIYRYRLEGSPKYEIGLLAQNVEKTHPEAVSSLGGIKHVNYKTATEDAVRGKYALGGGMPYGGGLSYVPQIQMQPMKMAAPQFVQAARPESGMNKVLENFNAAHGTMKGLGKLGENISTPISTTKDENSGWTTTTSQSGFGPWLKNNLGDLGGLAKYLPFNHGGVVRHGYQFGGLAQENPFDYYTSYVPDNSNFVDRTQTAMPQPQDPEPQDWETVTTPEKPTGLMSLGGPKDEEQSASLFGLKMSPEAADALMAAGFGMMASNSPFPLQAAGEGGLAGLGYYTRAMKQKQEQENELKKALIQHAAGGNTPASIEEYKFRLGLSPEQDRMFMEGKRGAKWIDAGTYLINAETNEKVDKNIFGAKEQEELGKASGTKKADVYTVNGAFSEAVMSDKYLNRSIENAKSLSNQFTTGMGSVLEFIRGNSQSDLAIAMRNIKANLAFDALRELKKAGGTLGAVSEKELSLLENAYVALEQAQSYEQFTRALDELVEIRKERAALREAKYREYIENYGEGKIPDYVTKAMEGTLVPPNRSNVRTFNPNTGKAE